MEEATMIIGSPVLLTNILTPDELEKTPSAVQEKLRKYLDGFYDEYCKEKAAANRLHDYEQKTEDLESQIQDYEAKIKCYEQNVLELRNQLDAVSSERAQLLELSNINQKELAAMRLEKSTAVDAHDKMLKVIERQSSELERMQEENRSYYQQMRSALAAKCDAIARLDQIDGKEVSLEFKERRMEQERVMLQNQIQTLTEDLNRNISELTNIRRDNSLQNMHLEARMAEKVEQLKIVQAQCAQYKETIDHLSQTVQELSSRIMHQSEESNKMMDFYKKELEAKTKLAELYKSNCDDTEMERSELSSAIADLKRMLQEASEQYGDLETNFKANALSHEKQLEERDKKLEALQTELRNANVLLKDQQDETIEKAISKIAPSAAVACKLIRADISLTELYSLYVKTSEELELKNREIARLKLQHNTILQELSENAPNIKRREIDHDKLKETYNIILQQRDDLLAKKADIEEVMQEAHTKINQLERENKRLRHTHTDLSQQVCHLIKEVEHLRNGMVNDRGPPPDGSLLTTDEIISKKLVKFSNIEELQLNNEKLMTVIRELSAKLEDVETQNAKMKASAGEEKIVANTKKEKDRQETYNQQNSAIATMSAKCDRYKKLFFQLQRRYNKNGTDDLSELDESTIDTDGMPNVSGVADATGQSVKSAAADEKAERRINELEQQLNDVNSLYKTLKENHEQFTKERKENEKILHDQFDSMRTEVRELTSANCKLMASFEYNKEQLKLQQKNVEAYKTQIGALEDRNKNYEVTIIKHEQTVHYLKDEVMKMQRNYSKAESEANNLRHESRMLKDSVARLQAEKEGYHRDHQSQSLMLNNLELIKTNLERSEMEGRARLEQRLDETVRELSAQRRRFQEEEDRFRESTAQLKRETETAIKRMKEERAQADKLRAEMITLREELSKKTLTIDDLSKKLQESLTPSKNDNPIVLANKKARDFEVKCEEAKIEIDSLGAQLAQARAHAEQYFKMSQSAEIEIKKLHELHTESVAKAESDIKQLQASELNLKSQIVELEADVQLARVSENDNKQPDQRQKLQDDLKDALLKVSECNRSLRELRAENSSLAESLIAVETKYANEMVLHSADIQELAKLKAELSKIQGTIDEMSSQRDSAQSSYQALKTAHEAALEMMLKEKEELEKRIVDINGLNGTLHDQIEALTAKLSLLSQTQTGGNTSLSDSLVPAGADTSGAELNRSNFEEECKNSDQLLQIIKYLRREKDLIDAKLDILKAENSRLLNENAILHKKVQQLDGFLNEERTKSEAVVISATKHEEILRKIETLNALTDSNRSLREERNALSKRVKEQNESISKLEDELLPLQSRNRELTSTVEVLKAEAAVGRADLANWRKCANNLLDKNNMEEFKRVKSERESLAKMLTSEKELLRQTLDELNALKADKTRLDSDYASLERQLHAIAEEKKKLGDEYATLKQGSQRMTQDLMELKNKLLQREDTLQKLTEDVEQKESQLQDSKNKEIQIRKIAKRYKDSYMELLNKTAASEGAASATPDNVVETGVNANVGAETSAATINAYTVELDQKSNEINSLNNKINSLNNKVHTLEEDNNQLRKDRDTSKAVSEIDERTKSLLREARVRIVSLQESNKAMLQELNTTKMMLQSNVQAAESSDATKNAMKSQYEETCARLEKELLEQNNYSKEVIARLTRENETLLMRISHLNRQLGLQQTAKPSTSSVANSDKSTISESSPRTANVKPMSGSTTVQQSATVTPWRGETPLASIRPISMQNSRTAAILPTSQQTAAGGSSSTSSSSSSSSSNATSAGSSNTALVPPQQQVHTTGSTSVESIASSSPTSSHTDYMPSTSSASVAVAAIPPMGTASAAESSQEAESIQQQQPNESQPLLVSGGQQQVVALVSPRVEASSQNTNASPNLQQLQQEPINQQPSTSGTTSSTSHIAVSSHSRHTPSSSSVTTTQAGPSGGHKRPRDQEGDSSTGVEESGPGDKSSKHPKRMRTPLHIGESGTVVGVTDSEVEYQVPTSSQRDQEDDIVVVDSEEDEEEEEDGMTEADDGPADGDAEHEGYEDSYEQDADQDMDDNDCPEINESNMRVDDDVEEPDNNEVDVDDGQPMQCTSETDNQAELAPYVNDNSASTSQAAAAALAHSQQQDNHQQSQAISSGSYETIPPTNGLQTGQGARTKPATSLTRQQKATLIMLQQGMSVNASDGSEQDPSGSGRVDGLPPAAPEKDAKAIEKDAVVAGGSGDDDVAVAEPSVDYVPEEHTPKKSADPSSDECNKAGGSVAPQADPQDSDEADDEFAEDAHVSYDNVENVDSESHQQDSGGATQSEIQDIQQSQLDVTSEENEGADGVSSEGEKQTVEMEEEGREAEATTTPSINTRSKTTKGSTPTRRASRGFQRGGRPIPITWQESPGNSRNMSPNHRSQDQQQQPGSAGRGGFQRGQRSRRMRRPTGGGGNYGNMRFS